MGCRKAVGIGGTAAGWRAGAAAGSAADWGAGAAAGSAAENSFAVPLLTEKKAGRWTCLVERLLYIHPWY